MSTTKSYSWLGKARYIVAGIWFSMAALKLSTLDTILDSQHTVLIVTVTISEAFLGFFLWGSQRVHAAWRASLLFSLGLLGFAFFGPILPDCHCLGFFVELGIKGRTSLACGLVGVSLLGMAIQPAHAKFQFQSQ